MKFKWLDIILIFISAYFLLNCKGNDEAPVDPVPESPADTFYFGMDLSYVNHIIDKGGIYKDQNEARSPYKIFKDHGANLVRLRLWHSPVWTKDIYEGGGIQMYNDLKDVEKAIRLSKEQGLAVLLDIHYSDTWADPDGQEIPAAWADIRDINVLKDSVYNYTRRTLEYLESKHLLPEMVQIGNETNCGMLYTAAGTNFPSLNVCKGSWQNFGEVINSGIQAVRDVSSSSTVKTKVVLHVADPKNVEWWFDNIISKGKVTDFDVVGFSYYPLWHTTVSLDNLSASISKFKLKYNRKVIVLETAYPWTSAGNDSYNNLFGGQTPLSGFPFSVQGQYNYLLKITQEIKDGGGEGIIYWEPAWISSDMKDLWGTGSSWENCTFFDFQGNATQSIDFMKYEFE